MDSQPLALHYRDGKHTNHRKGGTATFALLIAFRTLFLLEVA